MGHTFIHFLSCDNIPMEEEHQRADMRSAFGSTGKLGLVIAEDSSECNVS